MSIHFAINLDKNQNHVYLGSYRTGELEKTNLITEMKDKELTLQQREIALLEQKIADQQKIITFLENKATL